MENLRHVGPKAEPETVDEYLVRLRESSRGAVVRIISAELAKGGEIASRDADTGSLLRAITDDVTANAGVLTHDEWFSLVFELGSYFRDEWSLE